MASSDLVAPLLCTDDGPPCVVIRRPNRRFLVICDHASNAIPRRLGTLGISASALSTHIGWDIGARWVAERVSERLDATLIVAGYSRLVVDCNRYPWDPASIIAHSDGVSILGNAGLSAAARTARINEIFMPYQRAVAAALEDLLMSGSRPLFLSIHSCTPQLAGQSRPWHIGLSYARSGSLSHRLIAALRFAPDLIVGDNQPYSMNLGSDYSTPEHALRRGLDSLQVEFRQDLVSTQDQAHIWADRFLEGLGRIEIPAQADDPPWLPAWQSPHAG